MAHGWSLHHEAHTLRKVAEPHDNSYQGVGLCQGTEHTQPVPLALTIQPTYSGILKSHRSGQKLGEDECTHANPHIQTRRHWQVAYSDMEVTRISDLRGEMLVMSTISERTRAYYKRCSIDLPFRWASLHLELVSQKQHWTGTKPPPLSSMYLSNRQRQGRREGAVTAREGSLSLSLMTWPKPGHVHRNRVPTAN